MSSWSLAETLIRVIMSIRVRDHVSSLCPCPSLRTTTACLCRCYSFALIRGPERLSKIVPTVENSAAAPVNVREAVCVLLHPVLVVHFLTHGAHEISDGIHLRSGWLGCRYFVVNVERTPFVFQRGALPKTLSLCTLRTIIFSTSKHVHFSCNHTRCSRR